MLPFCHLSNIIKYRILATLFIAFKKKINESSLLFSNTYHPFRYNNIHFFYRKSELLQFFPLISVIVSSSLFNLKNAIMDKLKQILKTSQTTKILGNCSYYFIELKVCLFQSFLIPQHYNRSLVTSWIPKNVCG